VDFGVADAYLRYFIFGPAFDTLTFNFDTDPARVVPTGDFLNATDPDLSLFKANGGKLLIWNGWADPVVTPVRVVRYFLDIVDTLGEDTLQFSRLFMAPGVHHCGGGSGPNNFDMLAPLANWVEQGVAPDRIIASHLAGNVSIAPVPFALIRERRSISAAAASTMPRISSAGALWITTTKNDV